jgi:hypothetical protein
MLAGLSRKLSLAAFVISALSCKTPETSSNTLENSEGNRLDWPEIPETPEPAEWKTLQSKRLSVDQFDLVTFPSSEITKYMLPGSDDQNVPPNLQGIWWMDGNPLAVGDVVSFAKVLWDLPNHRFLLQEYGPNNMTVAGNKSGMDTFASTVNNNLCLMFQFDKDYTFAQLYQTNRVPGTELRIKLPPTLINYKLKREPSGDYIRQTWIELARIPDYHMRRIIDGRGNPVEPNYSNWKKIAPANFTMPVSMKDRTKGPG